MKKEFLKIAKKYNFEVVKYKSFWSDMMCRQVHLTILKNGQEHEIETSYWNYDKKETLMDFEKDIVALAEI